MGQKEIPENKALQVRQVLMALPVQLGPRGPKENRARRAPQVRTERVPIPLRRKADIPKTRPALMQISRPWANLNLFLRRSEKGEYFICLWLNRPPGSPVAGKML